MATAVKTTVTELPESRVRVDAEVPPEEIERGIERAARSLAREMKIPGFRRGKVPTPVVLQRVGRDAVLDQAVRGSIGGWYADAIDAAGIVPVGDPQLDLGALPPAGEPLTFSIEIGVRPTASLGEYRGLEVGRREPEVGADAVDAELEGLRERLATLATVEVVAERSDFLVIDYLGTLDGEPFEGGEGRDQLVELGGERLIPGFEEQLVGASAGEERAIEVTFPDDYGAEHLAGKPAAFAVTVKEVKRKQLSALDDDFAVEAGYDTLAELREDVERRLRQAHEDQIDAEFRQAAVDAVVERATVDVPEDLVRARAAELVEQLLHSLAHQGISKDAYLRISGQTDEQLLEQALPDAEQSLKREAVLAALVEAEGVEPSEDELLAALASSAERERTTPKKLRDRLAQAGRLEQLRTELAARQAVDLVAAAAKPIPAEQAKAREQLWTPEKEAAEAPGKLWTPGG